MNVFLNSQVVVPKGKGEILGVVIVESGWGSMLPTVVIANLAPAGAAARCGQLNIGDQIIAVNGVSLVGLPLSTCQTYIKVRLWYVVPFWKKIRFFSEQFAEAQTRPWNNGKYRDAWQTRENKIRVLWDTDVKSLASRETGLV